MSEISSTPPAHASREEILSAVFANMIIQQTNMALMFLGKVPASESGETIQDVEAARMLIDQLEMLEFKTRGNLDKREEGLLKQSLTALRMSFVELIEGKPEGTTRSPAASEPAQPSPAAATPAQAQQPAPAPPAEEESRKKFTKKY